MEEELYYSSSKNKDADQLGSYCEADLHFCFRIGRNPFFSWHGSNNTVICFILSCTFSYLILLETSSRTLPVYNTGNEAGPRVLQGGIFWKRLPVISTGISHILYACADYSFMDYVSC